MPRTQELISRKTVDDMLIAGIRFRGQPDAIPMYFDRLHAQVAPHINGPAICLYHQVHPKLGYDIEVCYPVSGPVEEGDVRSRVLEGGPMLCAAVSDTDAGSDPTWQRVSAYIGEHFVGIAEGASREILREDDTGARRVIEVQVPLLLPLWLERLAGGLDRQVGEDSRRHIMAGSEALAETSPLREKGAWTCGMMMRLESVVDDEAARRDIIAGCAHRWPADRIAALREEYTRLGDLDAFLEALRDHPAWGGAPFVRARGAEGNVLHVTKRPRNPKQFKAASTDLERRLAYCFCPLARSAMKSGQALSGEFCNCGGGYYKIIWEGIVGEPVPVEVVKSVLRGDNCCTFAIHLPPEA